MPGTAIRRDHDHVLVGLGDPRVSTIGSGCPKHFRKHIPIDPTDSRSDSSRRSGDGSPPARTERQPHLDERIVKPSTGRNDTEGRDFCDDFHLFAS